MSDLLLSLGGTPLRQFLKSLLMLPVPWLALLALALLLRSRRPRASVLVSGAAIAGLWLTATQAVGNLMTLHLLQAPPPLRADEIAPLVRAPHTAIVVLGGGRRPGPEYGGDGTLNARSVERLRYGIHLARQTGLPLAFSGGRGHGDSHGPTEAGLAAAIAEREFHHPLRWLEDRSRDTAENGRHTVALLQAQGIRRIVLVTHSYHLPRARRDFERAAAPVGIAVVPAATGTPPLEPSSPSAGSWLPSLRGFETSWLAWHEWLGLLAGA